MTTEGSTLLSNSQLRHAGGVATPRLEGGGARGVSGERLQLNTGLHRHNLAGDRELKVSEDTNLVLSKNIVLKEDLYSECRENCRKISSTPLLPQPRSSEAPWGRGWAALLTADQLTKYLYAIVKCEANIKQGINMVHFLHPLTQLECGKNHFWALFILLQLKVLCFVTELMCAAVRET